jgi:hypothetical protein
VNIKRAEKFISPGTTLAGTYLKASFPVFFRIVLIKGISVFFMLSCTNLLNTL